MHSCVFLVWIHRFSRFFGSILWPLSLHSQDEVKAAQKNSRRPDHVYSKAVRSPKTNRIAKCFDQRQRFIIAALFISEIYPHACCWKWAFSPAMYTIHTFGKRYDRESEYRAWARGQISLDRLLRVFFVDWATSVEGNLTKSQRLQT